MLITVETPAGSTTLRGAITFKTVGLKTTALDTTVTWDPVEEAIPVEVDKTPVQTINGIGPDSHGSFFLSGSDCTSWGYIRDGIAVGAGYKDADGADLPDPHIPGVSDTASGIWITDLCPACSSCETLYRLKQEVILMKLWLAVLRDVSLFQQHSPTISQTELTEAQWLWQRRFPAQPYSPACGAYLLGDDFSEFASDQGYKKGVQLIQQYMTTVHMWNYLVNRNNKSDVISIAPEDTAGFVVQTKRSVTSCGDEQTISCNVSIVDCHVWLDDSSTMESESLWKSGRLGNDLNSYAYPVSMLIPRAVVEFVPFAKQEQDQVGIPAQVATTGGGKYNMALTEGVTCAPPDVPSRQPYLRAASTGTLPVIAAGTYTVTVKFLPFINSRMVDENGDTISIRGTKDYTVTGETVGNNLEFHFFAEDTAPTYLGNPTPEQYIEAKTAPTVSVNFKLLWTIQIEWTVVDEDAQGETQPKNTEVSTYYYLCNGIRQYYSASVIGPSTINISGETSTTGTSNA